MRFRLNEFEKAYPHILGRMLEFITKSYFEVTGYPEVRMRFDDHAVMKRNKEIDVLAVNKDQCLVALVECSTGIPAGRTQLAEFIRKIAFKDQCLHECHEFDAFDVRKFVVTTRSQVAFT